MWPFEKKDNAQPVPEDTETPGDGQGVEGASEPGERTEITRPEAATHAHIDVNQPIENPNLVEAIRRHAQYNSPETSQNLFVQLNEATYLIVFFDDEVKMTPGDHEGETILEQGSVLKMPTCTDANDQVFLPLFTDWDEIKAWIEEPVSTLVMPAAETWDFVLQDKYDGAVINPAGQPLPLEPQHLQALLANG